MTLLLGIDVGTSSVKAVVIDTAGQVLATASVEHPLIQPRIGWSEQDPGTWWDGTAAAVRHVLATPSLGNNPAERIAGVGLSGQMHGSVLLDRRAREHQGAHAQPLRPAILWNDQRTAAECSQIEKEAGGRRSLVERVGNAALTGFTLPKLLWVRGHEPHLWAKVAHVLLPKDFIRLKLTGDLATDVGDASGTLLFNVDERAWHGGMLDRLGVSPAILPPVYESAAVTGRITPWAATQTGLREGTPVVGGSGDNQAGAVGAGVVSRGHVLATLGTSGVVYAHADEPRKDLPPGDATPGRLHTMCAATGTDRDRRGWCVTGVTLSAAGSLHWARDRVFDGASFDGLMREAESASPGCDGLVFLPYLTGERCPYADPDARGGWIGLSSSHSRAHLIRSILEGVTFSMGQVLDLVRSTGVPADAVRVGGGGARSSLWLQMLADVMRVPIESTNTEEGPAFGAALLAGVGAGIWPSVEAAASNTVRITRVHSPGPDSHRYEQSRERHRALWPAIRGIITTPAASASSS